MTSIPPPSLLVPGQLLDRYELLCPIAQGGMAQVWVARLQGKLGFEKLVAIKTIIAQHAMEERFEKMFLDEARIIAGIRHPNVAQILDLGQHADIVYLVLEWIDGDSAASLRRAVHGKGEKLPLSIALRIVADSCAGLHAAHELKSSNGESLGVVHRDVSPSNVLVSISGEVKLIDFGVAKAVDRVSEETAAGVIKGKVAYMAPEQALGKKVDRRADIWSCGVMLYHLLAGKTPYEAENQIATLHKVVQGLPPEPLRGVPPEVAELAYTALSYAPEGRFASADEMQRALERILNNHCGPVTPSDVASFVHLKLAERVAKRKRTIQRALDAAEQRKALAVEFEDAIEQSSSSIYGVGELRTPATMSSVSQPKSAPAPLSVSEIMPPSSRPPKSSQPKSAPPGPLPPVPVTPSSFPPTVRPPPMPESAPNNDPPPLAHAFAPVPHDPEATGRVVPVRPMDPDATIPVSRTEPPGPALPPVPRVPDFSPKPEPMAVPKPIAPLITVAEDIPPPRPMMDSLVEMRKFGTRRRGPMIAVGMLAAALLLAYGAYLAWDRVSTDREMSQPPPARPDGFTLAGEPGYSRDMKSRIWGAAVLVTLGVIATAGGCGSDDDGGGGGGTAGKDAATGGGTGGTTTGGNGGTGGTTTGGNGGTATGGNAGTTGCPAAPNDCNICEGDEYASCACEAEETACFDDIDCSNIFDCVYTGTDAGVGPCLDVSAAGAACVLECADAFPAGKAKYLAYDGCVYCDYCKTACGASEYCDAFTGTGGTAGSTGPDAATDAKTD